MVYCEVAGKIVAQHEGMILSKTLVEIREHVSNPINIQTIGYNGYIVGSCEKQEAQLRRCFIYLKRLRSRRREEANELKMEDISPAVMDPGHSCA